MVPSALRALPAHTQRCQSARRDQRSGHGSDGVFRGSAASEPSLKLQEKCLCRACRMNFVRR